jgi:hypothetical protein
VVRMRMSTTEESKRSQNCFGYGWKPFLGEANIIPTVGVSRKGEVGVLTVVVGANRRGRTCAINRLRGDGKA